jgi:hypothetical protein
LANFFAICQRNSTEALKKMSRFVLIAMTTAALVLISASSHARIRTPTDQKAKGDWTPPNPDAPLEGLDTSAPCDLPDLLARTGEGAKEMVDNLQSFTARETLEYEELDPLSIPTMADRSSFEYAVGFERMPNALKVTEARSPVPGGAALPAKFQDSGLPTLALIFHPVYQGDYEMSCEGAVQENGRKTWVVHFGQRKDKKGRTRSFRTDQGSYPLKLKGRAWISADSHHVVRLETALIAGIGMIHLRSDGVNVEYAPVQFKSKNLSLWLPQSSECYSDFETYRIVIKHHFSNYLLASAEAER